MDQQQEKRPPPRIRLDNLHRGALGLLGGERLAPKKQSCMASPAMKKQESSSSMKSMPDRVTPEREESCGRLYALPLKQYWSEPRTGMTRRRCNSNSVSLVRPNRLFDDKDDDINMEAFGLRRRKGKREAIIDCDSPAGLVRRTPVSPRYQARSRSRWLIPSEHPLKILWDVLTVILSLAHAHSMHVSIRDRQWGNSPFMMLCNTWFLMDILLNFVTERKTSEGDILRDYRSICARYLTSWFAVDALSLFPWEVLYVKPIVDLQKRRGFFQKSFFRSRAVVRVTTHLRGKHFRWFGKVARQTKNHGVGATRLLRLIIKYVPKYVLFFRNMKGIVAFRVLRQFQWCRRFYTNLRTEEKGDNTTGSLSKDDFEDDLSSNVSDEQQGVEVVYEQWEVMDDAVPL